MKLSLDCVGYGGYFTDGQNIPAEEALERASRFGYDAMCIYAHRPIGFPMDFDQDRRKRLKEKAEQLDMELGAVVCCTNFMEGDHVLLYPQEKEILYVRDAIQMAKDLDIKIVRVLAAFYGYFHNQYARSGYGNPAFESRSQRVSQNKDWLEAWHQVRRGLTETAKIAEDNGVVLALQTHPEITCNNEETLEMIDEVGVSSLKVGLDLPLLESQDPDFIRKTVYSMKDLMVYSHTISIVNKKTVGGAVFAWEEVTPGSPKDQCNWETFIKAAREIGYNGYLSHEQCSPMIVKGHKIADIDEVDLRYVEAINFFKPLLKKLDCYTGHKENCMTEEEYLSSR
ncbi:MAG: sugar phosphate isomerase/epimerase [Candidatus Omnitrophica bacterium]|nr:sugar phosphate isomerase/epimerase [Candidatus Omnitrophota bacterium]